MADEHQDPGDAIERQMAGQWTAMLHLMTQQGASRLDIMELAAATALVLITITGVNLWPQGEAVDPELNEAAMFTAAQAELEALQAFIRHRKEGGTGR